MKKTSKLMAAVFISAAALASGCTPSHTYSHYATAYPPNAQPTQDPYGQTGYYHGGVFYPVFINGMGAPSGFVRSGGTYVAPRGSAGFYAGGARASFGSAGVGGFGG